MPIKQSHQDLSQVDAIITGTRGVQKNTSTIKAIKKNWINCNLKNSCGSIFLLSPPDKMKHSFKGGATADFNWAVEKWSLETSFKKLVL